MTAILRGVADWFTGSVEAELAAAKAELEGLRAQHAKDLSRHESDLRKLDAARTREAALEGTVGLLRADLAELLPQVVGPVMPTRTARERQQAADLHVDCTPAPERERLLVQLGWCRKQLAERGITTWPPPVKVGAS